MKLSKLFNESALLSQFSYKIFKSYHNTKELLRLKDKSFNYLGDKPSRLYIPYHPIPENNLYGHIVLFQNYLGSNLSLRKIHIQHGVIFGELVQQIMIDSYGSTIITFSTKRRELILKKVNKKVIAVGPYIRYAPCRLNAQELADWKNKMGKTLLVFPAHSPVNRGTVDFDSSSLVKRINEIKEENNVNTVLINLYYTDVNSEAIKFYKGCGFKVCSAGYWLSENFLANLRTIIELSDITMSNDVGTHLGYCLALNKPHYIYRQETTLQFAGKRGLLEKKQFDSNYSSSQADISLIENAFINSSFQISDLQKSIVNDFWGNDIFYSPEQLSELIDQ